jgi:hypothetical protein
MNHDFNAFLREDVKNLVNKYASKKGVQHGECWRLLYNRLLEETAFRPPEDRKRSKIDYVEEAGFLDKLHQIALTLK